MFQCYEHKPDFIRKDETKKKICVRDGNIYKRILNFPSINISTFALYFLLALFSQKSFAFPLMMQQPAVPIAQYGAPAMFSQQILPDMQQQYQAAIPQTQMQTAFDPSSALVVPQVFPQTQPFIDPINPGRSLGNIMAPGILNAIGLDPSYPPSPQSQEFLSGYRAALQDLANRISSAYVVKETVEKLKDLKPMNPYSPMFSPVQGQFGLPGMPGFPSPFGYPSPYDPYGMFKPPYEDEDLDEPPRKKKKSKRSKRRSKSKKRSRSSRRKPSRSSRSRKSKRSSRIAMPRGPY